MNARLSKENVVRTGKRLLRLAGLASLALLCAGEVLAQSQPAQTQSAVARPVAVATVPAISPGAQSSNARAAAGQTSAQSSSAKVPAPKGRPEGITVYGWWTIEVRNPDGKVVIHREFENALTETGQGVLASAITNQGTPLGYNVPGAWQIQLCNSGGSICNPTASSTNTFDLRLEQQGGSWASATNCPTSPTYGGGATDTAVAIYCYPTLAIALSSSGATLSLTGNIPSSPLSGTVTIDTVQSDITQCLSSAEQIIAPSTCFTNPGASSYSTLVGFTLASLTPTVSVQQYQSISVTVTFSFSPAPATSGASVPAIRR